VTPKAALKAAPSRGTISLFSGPAKAAAKAPVVKKAPVKKAAPIKAAPKDTIPVLSRWTQNDDGSITGFVSNSPNFRDNTKITTSPVRKGVKEAQLVKTGSGSQYRLN
jgi:hypothetical protein